MQAGCVAGRYRSPQREFDWRSIIRYDPGVRLICWLGRIGLREIAVVSLEEAVFYEAVDAALQGLEEGSGASRWVDGYNSGGLVVWLWEGAMLETPTDTSPPHLGDGAGSTLSGETDDA
ncbi:MAG TPA: hypothetical protein VI008_02200 [Rubrobacter sp.]